LFLLLCHLIINLVKTPKPITITITTTISPLFNYFSFTLSSFHPTPILILEQQNRKKTKQKTTFYKFAFFDSIAQFFSLFILFTYFNVLLIYISNILSNTQFIICFVQFWKKKYLNQKREREMECNTRVKIYWEPTKRSGMCLLTPIIPVICCNCSRTCAANFFPSSGSRPATFQSISNDGISS